MIRFFTAALILLTAGAFMTKAHAEENTVKKMETAIFAAGCFWCIESDLEKLDGVHAVVSGYIGGQTENPTYEQVSSGGTSHYEAVRVEFDPGVIAYDTLLESFWRNHDPFDTGGQFCDRGDQYRAAIFTLNEQQKQIALASKEKAQDRLGETIVTPILDAARFYDAEDYHQDYYKKSPVRYKFYRWNCGRDQRLREVNGEG
jgi:peptide-methionine (S)-S-oxide reductase